MPDFPYVKSRDWVNKSEGWVAGDPTADALWFERTEAALHQGQDHEKALPVAPAVSYADGQILRFSTATGFLEPVDIPASGVQITGTPADGQFFAWDAASETLVPVNAPSGGAPPTDPFKAKNTDIQTFPVVSSTYQKVLCPTVEFDAANNYNEVASQLVAPAAEVWSLSAHLGFNQTQSGAWYYLALFRNGTNVQILDELVSHALGIYIFLSGTAFDLSVAPGDVWEVRLMNTGSRTIDIYANEARFWGSRA